MAEERLGLTFGRVAGAYDRLRPAFASGAVDYAVESLGLGLGASVLDLAAGTGTLTRALRARLAEVIAVEPDDAMRAYVGGDARVGYAEAIPLEDSSVDAVFVGDAFVWFDAPRALAELERVLTARRRARPVLAGLVRAGGSASSRRGWPMADRPLRALPEAWASRPQLARTPGSFRVWPA